VVVKCSENQAIKSKAFSGSLGFGRSTITLMSRVRQITTNFSYFKFNIQLNFINTVPTTCLMSHFLPVSRNINY